MCQSTCACGGIAMNAARLAHAFAAESPVLTPARRTHARTTQPCTDALDSPALRSAQAETAAAAGCVQLAMGQHGAGPYWPGYAGVSSVDGQSSTSTTTSSSSTKTGPAPSTNTSTSTAPATTTQLHCQSPCLSPFRRTLVALSHRCTHPVAWRHLRRKCSIRSTKSG
jgi:hypothetical protein